jgi:hypothetical protein
MSFPLVGNQILLGREEGLDITLQAPEASRRHTQITWQAGQFVIADMGSTNGTFVNGVQITTPQILSPGDSIGIGQTALVFQVAGPQVAAPPPVYQAPRPQPARYAAPPPQPAARSGVNANQIPQCALYGCGCLLLWIICALLGVAFLFILNPSLLDSLISASPAAPVWPGVIGLG